MTCEVGADPSMRVVVDTGWKRPAMTRNARRRAQGRIVGTLRGAGWMRGGDYELVSVDGVRSATWRRDDALDAVVDDGVGRVVPGSDMLIGADTFLACGPVRISVGGRKIEFVPDWAPSGTEASVPLQVRDGVPWVTVQFGAQTVDLAVDTGSDATISISADALASGALSVEDRTLTATTAGHSFQWSPGRLLVPVAMGGLVIDPGRVYVVDGPTADRSLTHHIGRGLLRRLDVVLDVRGRRAWVVPRAESVPMPHDR